MGSVCYILVVSTNSAANPPFQDGHDGIDSIPYIFCGKSIRDSERNIAGGVFWDQNC